MLVNRFFKSPSYMLLGLFSLALIVLSQQIKPERISRTTSLITPPQYLNHLSFGFQEAMADSFWIRTIQDLDYCSSEISEGTCQNHSWLYRMIDTITELSPHFRVVYVHGGLALTIVITDIDGASKIYEKALKYFPSDWKLNYHAAYHYIYEVKDKVRAAELLQVAGKNGAPNWVLVLAGRLYSDAGDLELAKRVLHDMIQSKEDPLLIERLREKIRIMEEKK